MSGDQFIHVGEGFWNIRGSHKVAMLIDVGTQCSLVQLKSGSFILLDAYTLNGDVLDQVMQLTDQGKRIEAVCHLHPFHTVHVNNAAKLLPHAKQYGTRRHHEQSPDVQWEVELTDSQDFQDLYADDLIFTVPRGVDLISNNENVHFSSVLALHKASGALHVDDTLMWVDLPLVGGLSFHMTLKGALEKRPGAAADFRAWAESLILLCEDVNQLCTAHGKSLPPKTNDLPSLVRGALESVASTLDAHAKKYG